MKNLIHTAVVTLFAASAAHAQQGTYFSKVDFNSISNLKHQGCGYSCCPGFTAGSSYPLGEQVYDGVPFAHGLPDSYAFTSQNSCTRPGEAFQVAVNFPGDGSIYMLLSSWSGCAGGPAFLLKANLSDGTARTWRLENQVDYRDHNGICTLSGSRCRQVWTNGGAQHLDLLSVPVEAPGKTVVSVRLESEDPLNTTAPLVYGLTLSSSADCNNDGIVDYGQCRNGTLPDYNVNNVPDCCEQGTPCLPGRYPLQWRSEDGGNGNWYQASANLGLTFLDARARATIVGGDLVTPQSPAELDFVFRNLASDPAMWWYANGIPRHGPWIGLRQDRSRPDYSEPAGGWTWIDGTDATFQNWDLDTCRTQPTDCFCVGGCGLDNAGFYEGDPASGNTVPTWGAFAADMSGRVGGVIIEWSGDCNNDNIVDYGQILQGQLGDTNADGIPDVCQQPTCVDADIYRDFNVNGADLGILLSQWGPNTPLTESDLNKDGFVNGADLGILLSFWGACP